jgi:pimeloyl-ACP methyl ester carboxylesterase
VPLVTVLFSTVTAVRLLQLLPCRGRLLVDRMRIRYFLFVLVGLALSLSGAVRAQERPSSNDADELQKLSSTLDLIRSRNAQDYAISTPNGIDEANYLQVGGIDQWVTIRGENRENPVVLVLHGGPGDTTNPYGHAAFRTWLNTYTVVQWDQRGAGKTLGRNGSGSAATLTIDRLVQDGVELADILRTSLRKDKIILLGHSWGSVLGVLMAKAKPDLFLAFVGTGQVGDPARSYQVAFDALLEKARASGDARALRELQEIGPPPYSDGRGYHVQRRWSNLLLDRWAKAKRLPAGANIQCARGNRSEWPIRDAGLRHPGLRGFHHTYQSGQGIRRGGERASQAICDNHRRALRRVHELLRVSETTRSGTPHHTIEIVSGDCFRHTELMASRARRRPSSTSAPNPLAGRSTCS